MTWAVWATLANQCGLTIVLHAKDKDLIRRAENLGQLVIFCWLECDDVLIAVKYDQSKQNDRIVRHYSSPHRSF